MRSQRSEVRGQGKSSTGDLQPADLYLNLTMEPETRNFTPEPNPEFGPLTSDF